MVVSKIIPLRRVDGKAGEMSDDALAAALATGETAALGALFDRHYTAVRAFLARLVGPGNPDLDDLVQQTFETVHKSASRFQGKSKVKTWMIGIAMNVARHHIRGSMRRKRLAEAYAVAPERAQRNPSDHAAGSERTQMLQAAILELPTKLREAFVLVYFEGMPGKEAAAALDVREGTIWKRLHQARGRLRESLKGAIE